MRREDIRRIAILAMFSDDDLSDLLVLKGGSALDIVYGVSFRASFDLDFSMEREFARGEMGKVEEKIRKALSETFREHGYEVFDLTFGERPETVSPEVRGFWGGYQIEFKVVRQRDYSGLAADLESMRRHAVVVNPQSGRKFRIDISKFEHCQPKEQRVLDGYTIYVYTPAMVVCEKLRSICQQMPEYLRVVKASQGTARARDFVDIYEAMQRLQVNLSAEDNRDLLREVFAAKRVPLRLIGEIHRFREYHRPDFVSVRSTVKPEFPLREFDFYFDYVAGICAELQALWEV